MPSDIKTTTARARSHYSKGKFDVASTLFYEVCQSDPDNIDAWIMHGACNLKMGKLKIAATSLQKALALKPESVTAQTYLASALALSGNLKAAASIYRKVVEQQPGNFLAWLQLGETLTKLRQFRQAESACQTALELQPGDLKGLMTLGKAYYKQGNKNKALDCYQQVLEQDPNHVNAYYRSGRILYELEDLDTAKDSLGKALERNPNHALAHYYLAHVLYYLNDLEESENAYRRTIELKPDHINAYIDLVTVLYELNKPEEAHPFCMEALERAPDNADIHGLLGHALRESGQLEDAASSYRKAIELRPQAADFHYRLGQVLRELGQTEAAVESLNEAFKLNPDKERYPLALGTLYQAAGNYEKALEYFRHALQINPASSAAYNRKGKVLYTQGRHQEAIESFRQALRYEPDSTDINTGLAVALLALSKHEEASVYCMNALSVQPDNPEAAALAAQIAVRKGDKQEAYDLLRPLLDSKELSYNVIMAFANVSKDVGRSGEAVQLLEQALKKDPNKTPETLVNLHFCLGTLYDSEAEYDKAFHHYHLGNSLKQVFFDPHQHLMEVESFLKLHSWQYMASLPRASIISERPIFIIGMPRSGTTLVEQIISSHPDVYGAGELTDIGDLANNLPARLGTQLPFPQCLSEVTTANLDSMATSYLGTIDKLSSGESHITDKMLGFIYLGLIELMLPHARVIHCMRDPLDTCMSIYFKDFATSHPYAYDLEHLGMYYQGYRKIMHNWKNILNIPIMDVQYEDLVANQEEVSRKLIEFCRLDWNDQCLRFHENKRFVSTASFEQVRRPMYTTSSGRWKNYEQFLDPLKDALRE